MNIYKLNKESLLESKEFYKNNEIKLDTFEIRTYDFFTGEKTEILYTKAKLVDMCGFMHGQ
jgi:hypothetical protein